MQNYVTASEAAEKLGIKYATLVARIRKGKIKAVKFGYALAISKTELAKQIEKAKEAK